MKRNQRKNTKSNSFLERHTEKEESAKAFSSDHDVDIDWDECNEQGEKLLQKWYKEYGDEAYMDLSDVFDEYEY